MISSLMVLTSFPENFDSLDSIVRLLQKNRGERMIIVNAI